MPIFGSESLVFLAHFGVWFFWVGLGIGFHVENCIKISFNIFFSIQFSFFNLNRLCHRTTHKTTVVEKLASTNLGIMMQF